MRGGGCKLGTLAALGGGMLVLGLVAERLGVPCIKHVFTFSFTLQAMGWCVLLLAFFYLLVAFALVAFALHVWRGHHRRPSRSSAASRASLVTPGFDGCEQKL